MKTIYVNLTPYKSLHNGAMTGREMGEYVKNQTNLDKMIKLVKDDQEIELEIQFPNDVHVISDSFLKGFLTDAYNTLGYDTFTARVKFFTNCEPLKRNLLNDMKGFVELLKRLNK
jgi:hypothetical protein